MKMRVIELGLAYRHTLGSVFPSITGMGFNAIALAACAARKSRKPELPPTHHCRHQYAMRIGGFAAVMAAESGIVNC
jgi:hypothetical protein